MAKYLELLMESIYKKWLLIIEINDRLIIYLVSTSNLSADF